jgi:hypothetical protein
VTLSNYHYWVTTYFGLFDTFAGDFSTDLIADFRVDFITERTIDFMADAPFLDRITLSTISFSFFSFTFSSDVILKWMSFFFAMI